MHHDTPRTFLSQPIAGTETDDPASTLPPVHRASTIFLPTLARLKSADWRNRSQPPYGRDGSRAACELETRLAHIEGARQALVVSSGLAAYALICMALLSPGDVVAMPTNGYGTAQQMLRNVFHRFAIGIVLYDPMVPDTWAEAVPPSTRLLCVEAPGSVTMEVPDLRRLAGFAEERGCIAAIDNTYSAGLHLRVFELGFHVSIQALTKLQSGGADLVMGSVASAREDISRSLYETRHFLGMHVSPDDIYLVLRGLPTLSLRYAANTEASLRLAEWFSEKQEIAAVMHPAFCGSQGHDHWKRYFTSSTSLFSIAFDAAVETEKIEAFLEALTLFHFGFSWGGPTSLVMFYGKETASTRQFAERHPGAGCIARFWLGLEDGTDLAADIFNAWSSAFGA